MGWLCRAELGLSLLVTACGGSSFSTADGGSDSGGSADASGDVRLDSGADQRTSDAGDATPQDAPGDALVDGSSAEGGPVDAGTGWCARNHPSPTCDDFDEWDADFTMDPTGWSVTKPAGAILTIATSMSSSPPDSIWIASSSTSSQVRAGISVPYTATPARVTLGFDLYLAGNTGCSMNTGNDISTGEIAFGSSAVGNYSLTFDLVPQVGGAPTASLVEQATLVQRHPLSSGVALNTWTTISVDVQFPSMAPATATVTITPGTSDTITLTPPSGVPSSAGGAGVGVTNVGDCSVYYDNVTVDIE